MKKIIKEDLIKNIILIFLIIQPIFDLKVFYNSVSTLIRAVLITVIFVIYFVKNKEFQKKNKKTIIYFILLFIYMILHLINAMNFKSLVPGNFNYSPIKEILYFWKMMIPFFLIYILLKSDIKSNKINLAIESIVVIMSLIIIVTNILGISYGSYSNEIIKANFVSWFKNQGMYTYKDLASKGLFEYANQISAVLLMFLPFSIYESCKKNKVLNYVVLLLNIIALLLLGTRVAVLGTIIVCIYSLLIILIGNKKLNYQKNKFKNFYAFIAIFIMYILILPLNPMFNRIEEMNNQHDITVQVDSSNIDVPIEDYVADENIEIAENDLPEINQETQDKIKYIKENYESKKIHEQFILKSYPYKYDPDFWIEILNKDIYSRTNYRYIENQMIKRVLELNNNKLDMLFGITNTRLQNIFNIEQDFIVQYYSLGIVGVIIVFMPYAFLIGLYLSKVIKSKMKYCSIDNLMSVVTIFMIFGIAYNSGNLLNSLSFTIYFAILFFKLHIRT